MVISVSMQLQKELNRIKCVLLLFKSVCFTKNTEKVGEKRGKKVYKGSRKSKCWTLNTN